MKVVALCSMKGGTGKTTLSFNLAERGEALGLRVALVDMDPQEGSVGLADLREGSCWPVVRCANGRTAGDEIRAIRERAEYDLVVCDLPGGDSLSLGMVLAEMDLVLSPVGVGAADLGSAANFSWFVKRMGLPAVFVGNNVPFGEGRRLGLVEELEEFGVEVCPVMVRRRVAHMDALRVGMGVCEAFPGSAAAGEVEALWEWVAGRLEVK